MALYSFYCTSTLFSSRIYSLISLALFWENKLWLFLLSWIVLPLADIPVDVNIPRCCINWNRLFISGLGYLTLAVCVELGVDAACAPTLLAWWLFLFTVSPVKFVFINTACSVMSCYVAELLATLVHNSFSVTLLSFALCNGSKRCELCTSCISYDYNSFSAAKMPSTSSNVVVSAKCSYSAHTDPSGLVIRTRTITMCFVITL